MGLVDYGSDSDSDVSEKTPLKQAAVEREEKKSTEPETLKDAPKDEDIVLENAPELGPAPGPAAFPTTPPRGRPSSRDPQTPTRTPSTSPYTTTRNTIHSLTLPTTFPTLPPSPTTKPSSKLEKKLTHFLVLKSRGVHFNQTIEGKIQGDGVAREIEEKIMKFAGLEMGARYSVVWGDDEGKDWARGEGLRETLKGWEERKKKERERVSFVVGKKQ